MLTAFLSLFGGGLGGLLRFIPEIFKLFSEGKDREHEYRMTQLQLEIDKARSDQAIDLVHAQGEEDKAKAAQALELLRTKGDVAQDAGELQAYVEAIKGQSVMSGVPWVDALSQSVRPVLTYWWMLLFTVYKVCTITAACLKWTTLNEFINMLWTVQDAGVLAMILGFWFCDRAIRKNSGR